MRTTGTFCTVFDCMDGRCQGPTLQWCQDVLGAQYPDTITLPGMDAILAERADDDGQLTYVRDTMADISVNGHGSHVAVIVGHSGCAGNPVSDEAHRAHIRSAVERVAGWGKFDMVYGLFESVADREACTPEQVAQRTHIQ